MAADTPRISDFDMASGQLTERAMTAAEQAERAAYEDEQLGYAKNDRAAEVFARLADTDRWVARAYEDGVPLPDDRKAHRQALRTLLGKIDSAKTRTALDKIDLPDPPPNPS